MLAQIECQDVNCLLCGSCDQYPSDLIHWKDTQFSYVICRHCGLKYMTPRPTQAWYLDFYEQQFWEEKIEYRDYTGKGSKVSQPIDVGLQKRIAKQFWRARRIVRRISEHVPLSRDSLVLDVGAAFGVTLSVLRQRFHCRVLGVEPSEVARLYAEREFGVEFAATSVEELHAMEALDNQVSLLIMSHVLENIIDPRAALRSARRLLAPAGWLYVDTCNFYYYNAVNPYHPYVFSPKTLKELLACGGFHSCVTHHEPHPSRVARPQDPYLSVLAQPGPVDCRIAPVQVAQIVADQRLGIAKLKESKSAATASNMAKRAPRPSFLRRLWKRVGSSG